MKKAVNITCFCLFFLAECKALDADSMLLQQAKFKLLKNAVAYYAIDSNSGWDKKVDCHDIKELPELVECAKRGRNIIGNKVEEWSYHDVNDTADINDLRLVIITAMMNAVPSRRDRSDFKTFEERQQNIVIEVQQRFGTHSAEEPLVDKVNKKAGKNGDSATKGKNKTNPGKDSPNDNNDPFNLLLIIPIAFSILAVGYTWWSNAQRKKSILTLSRSIQKYSDSINFTLQERLSRLENDVRSFDGSMESLRDELLKKISGIKSKLIDMPVGNTSKFTNQEKQEDKTTVTVNPQPSITYKYARYADMGDGFSINNLSDEADIEKVFELIISSDNTAKFKISSDRNAQLLALHNPSLYFDKACSYTTTPYHNSFIENEKEGDLKLQGNKWQIVNPVKINFV